MIGKFGFGRRNSSGKKDIDRFEREVFFNRTREGQGENTPPYYEDNGPRFGARDHNYERDRSDNTPGFSAADDDYGPYRPVGQQVRPYSRQTHTQQTTRPFSFSRNERLSDLPEEEDEWADRPSPLKFVISITGIVVFAAALWFAYRWVSYPQSETPQLIQAEPGPYKVKPENPGGLAIPHQDKLIYGRITPGAEQPVERLLPPPEQPVMLPQQQQVQASLSPQQYVLVDPQTGAVQQVLTVPPAQTLPPPAASVQQAVPLQQPMPQHPPQAHVQQQAPVMYAPVPTSPSYVPQQQGGVLMQSSPSVAYAPQPQQSVTSPATITQPAPAQQLDQMITTVTAMQQPTPAVSAPQKGTFYIQLATLVEEKKAQAEADRLRKKFALDLPPLVRATSGPDVKYRVLAGPFQSKTSAQAKCTEFGGSCRVVDLGNG